MTARTMLLSDYEIERNGYGAFTCRCLYEAERNRLLDEIESLEGKLGRARKAIDAYVADEKDMVAEIGELKETSVEALRLLRYVAEKESGKIHNLTLEALESFLAAEPKKGSDHE